MKVKTLTMIMFFFLIISCFMIVFIDEKCEAIGNEIFVDDDFYITRDGSAEHPYETIQHAIDVAEGGDIIYVFGGAYNETLTINKKLTIVGSIEDGKSIINYGITHKYTIKITADDVNFSGFTINNEFNSIISQIRGALIYVTSDNNIIQNNTLTNCNNGYGLYLDSSDNNIINNNIINNIKTGIYSHSSKTNDAVNNIISSCDSSAVEIISSTYWTLYENTLDSNVYGVYIRDSNNINISNNTIENNNLRGIGAYNGDTFTVSKNAIKNNSVDGIYFEPADSKIIENVFDNNQIALNLHSSNCEIYGNYINNSLSIGISARPGSSGNKIYMNSFYDNVENANENGNNQWDYDIAGNYWDDYNEIDADEDGIGDTYYTKGGVQDKYPLGIFLSPPDKPINPSPSDGQDGVGLKIILSVNANDPDKDMMDVSFYKIVNESGDYIHTFIDIDTNVKDGGTASCDFNLPFDTTFLWYVTVDDGKLQNKSGLWYFSTRQRPADNDPPIAYINGSYGGGMGEAITFDASDSYDPDGTIDFYRWNFGDDTSEILSIYPTHTYDKLGVFTVTLTVIDNDGTSAVDSTVVEIGESILKDPVANAGGSYSGKVGGSVPFDGSNSYDEDGTIESYNWSFGDGKTGSGINPSHKYTIAGNYTVTLTVTDDSGLTHIDETYVIIQSKSSSSESPGFEIAFVFIAILLCLVMRKKIKK